MSHVPKHALEWAKNSISAIQSLSREELAVPKLVAYVWKESKNVRPPPYEKVHKFCASLVHYFDKGFPDIRIVIPKNRREMRLSKGITKVHTKPNVIVSPPVLERTREGIG